MSPRGPARSPAGYLAPATPVDAGKKVVDRIPADTVGPQYDPLVIGARWYNPGHRYTRDGAGARIAWARFDRTYTLAESNVDVRYDSVLEPIVTMADVFQSLAADN